MQVRLLEPRSSDIQHEGVVSIQFRKTVILSVTVVVTVFEPVGTVDQGRFDNVARPTLRILEKQLRERAVFRSKAVLTSLSLAWRKTVSLRFVFVSRCQFVFELSGLDCRFAPGTTVIVRFDCQKASIVDRRIVRIHKQSAVNGTRQLSSSR